MTDTPKTALSAEQALQAIAALEPRPFEMPADWSEQIEACPECRRYTGHPIQQGICDTHRRPLWDRQKHDEHERRAIGWRAKEIARAALSQPLSGQQIKKPEWQGEAWAHNAAHWLRSLPNTLPHMPYLSNGMFANDCRHLASLLESLSASPVATQRQEETPCGQISDGIVCNVPRKGSEIICPDCNPREPRPDVLAMAEEAKRLLRNAVSAALDDNDDFHADGRACEALIDRLAHTQEGEKQ